MSLELNLAAGYDQFALAYLQARAEGKLLNDYIEVPEMINTVGDVEGLRLLDVGCGSGIHLQQYVAKGAKAAGIDISKVMVELAQKENPAARIIHGSVYKLPFNEACFDIVTSSLALFHVEELGRAFLEISRVLNREGRLVYSDLHPFGYSEIPAVGNKFVENELLPGFMFPHWRRGVGYHTEKWTETGFQLTGFKDCYPSQQLRAVNHKAYEIRSAFPLFCIYSARKINQ